MLPANPRLRKSANRRASAIRIPPVMRKLKEWADEEEGLVGKDEDWEEIGEKVEKKLKRKLREWAEKE